MHTHFTAGFTATALLVGLTGCSLVNIETQDDGSSGGTGGSGSNSSTGQAATTSSTAASGGMGGGDGSKVSCAEAQNQTPASWAMALGDCREFVGGVSTCPRTQTTTDTCGLSYVAVHGAREVPTLADGQTCGAGELLSSETLIRAISANGDCQTSITINTNLPPGLRDLRISPSSTGGLFLRGSFKNRLEIDGLLVDQTEANGPSRRGFVAAMDPQGELEIVMHIDGITDDAEFTFGELTTNDNSLFLLVAAKGTFAADDDGRVRIVPPSSENERFQIAVVERRLDETSTVIHPIATQQISPFSPKSLSASNGVLAATFMACGTNDDCANLAFETDAEQLGSGAGSSGLRVWSMTLDPYYPYSWMRWIGVGASTASLTLSSQQLLRLVHRSYSSNPVSIYTDLENPASSSHANLTLRDEFGDAIYSQLTVSTLHRLAKGEAVIVGTFQGNTLRYKPTPGSSTVLSSEEAAQATNPPKRGFLVRLGTSESVPPYYEISSTHNLSLVGASEQGRDGNAIRLLINGRYDGTLHLADGSSLPASAEKSDFVASIVWP